MCWDIYNIISPKELSRNKKMDIFLLILELMSSYKIINSLPKFCNQREIEYFVLTTFHFKNCGQCFILTSTLFRSLLHPLSGYCRLLINVPPLVLNFKNVFIYYCILIHFLRSYF